jgi:hypothetical protein
VSFRHPAAPRVLDVDRSSRVERRADIPAGADRIALLAQWSTSAQLSLSTSRLVQELQEAGYWVVVSSTCPDPAPLVPHPEAVVRLGDLTVLRRENVGYDFGSWAVAMREFEPLLAADKVLVVNDSLVGPFDTLTPVIADFESTTADVWGMVQSRQVTPHLQSFFRGFRYGTLLEPPMLRFWRELRVVPDKLQLIAAYEYGFSALLEQHGFSTAAFVHAEDVVWGELNPTIAGWERLLAAGVPFVKRELLRRSTLVPDGARIRPVLAERYGVDVDQWW